MVTLRWQGAKVVCLNFVWQTCVASVSESDTIMFQGPVLGLAT
jgi:hypothetical protein